MESYFISTIIILLSITEVRLNPITPSDNPSCEPTKWLSFKQKFHKHYAEKREDSHRNEIFCNRLQSIDQHNSNPRNSFRMSLNRFADRTEHELLQSVGGLNEEYPGNFSSREELTQLMISNGFPNFLGELPGSVDWSLDPTRVGPVKMQGDCGSCWAFGVVAMLEGQQKLPNQNVTLLSEQNLVDCDLTAQSCQGVNPVIALRGIRKRGGVIRQSDYPYYSGVTKQRGTCRMNKNIVFNTTQDLGQIHLLPFGDEEFLMRMLAHYGPITVTVEAKTTFMYYSDGIYSDPNPNENQWESTHQVLLVGYGTDPQTGLAYWKVKNSWSDEWGERGYIRMIKDFYNNSKIAGYAVVTLKV